MIAKWIVSVVSNFLDAFGANDDRSSSMLVRRIEMLRVWTYHERWQSGKRKEERNGRLFEIKNEKKGEPRKRDR